MIFYEMGAVLVIIMCLVFYIYKLDQQIQEKNKVIDQLEGNLLKKTFILIKVKTELDLIKKDSEKILPI